jgi:hypothetical protein
VFDLQELKLKTKKIEFETALPSVLAKTLGNQALCRVLWPKHSANLGIQCLFRAKMPDLPRVFMFAECNDQSSRQSYEFLAIFSRIPSFAEC